MSRDLKVHVGENLDTIARRAAHAWRRAKRGEKVDEDHLTFMSWEALAKVLSGKRYELLRHLHRNPAASIAALARALGRDYKRVHEDVEALTAAGLVERSDEGLRADYNEIRTVVTL